MIRPSRCSSRWIAAGAAALLAALGGSTPLLGDAFPCDPLAHTAITGEGFGFALAAEGDRLAVGAPGSGALAGSVYLYERSGNGWSQIAQLRSPSGNPSERFGSSVALRDDTLVVGAPRGDGPGRRDMGVVYVFQRSESGAWNPTPLVLAPADAETGDRFGFAIALESDWLAASAPNDDDGGSVSGSVHLFQRSGAEWIRRQKLLSPEARPADQFGFSLAIQGTELAVGSPFADALPLRRNFGVVYVFRRSGAVWTYPGPRDGRLTAGRFEEDDAQFGSAVAIDDDLIVGARGDDGGHLRVRNRGAAYRFKRESSGWRLVSPLAPADGEWGAGDQMGSSVAIAADRVVAGVPFHRVEGARRGGAFVFPGSDPSQSFTGASSSTDSRFGAAVALGKEAVFLGGPDDDPAFPDAGSVAVCTGPLPPSSCLSITKTDHRSTVCPRDGLTYEITVSNGEGLGTVTGATVIDNFSEIEQLEGVRWECRPSGGASCTRSGGPNLRDAATLPENSQVLYTITATVAPDADGTILNRVRVTPPAGLTGANCELEQRHEAKDTTVIQASGNLAVSFPEPPGSVPQGEEASYTVEVTHSGAPMTGVLEIEVTGGTLVAPPPGCSRVAGGFTCDPDSFPAGSASVPRSFEVLPTSGCPCPSGPIVVKATVTATQTGCGEEIDDNTATAMTGVTCSADLDLTAFEVIPSPCGEVHYQANFTNHGPSYACAAKLVQSIPAGLTFVGSSDSCVVDGANVRCSTFGALVPGQMKTVLTRFAVPNACTNPIDSTATVSSTTPDPNTGNDSRFERTTCPARLRIKKTDVPDPVVPGQELSYDITVENFGASAASDVVVRDEFPSELTGVRWCEGTNCVPKLPPPLEKTIGLAAGETKIFRLSGNVPPMCSGELLNLARIMPPARLCDDPADNVHRETTQVSGDGVRAYCVGIDGMFLEGSMITKNFLLLNCGPAAQADNPGDEFTDILPAGLTLTGVGADSGTPIMVGNTATWNGSIPVGGMVMITITATINAGTAGTTFCNQATIAFDADGNGTNESIGLSDDPGEPGDADPCCFRVLFDFQVPTLSTAGLAAFALLLTLVAIVRLRRRAP